MSHTNNAHPQVCLCVHGHFYQPPRENAWIEDIEYQPSAAPYHDWNERIFSESYLPNSIARIFDPRHRIVDIINNYEFMNFNFGPTLMAWLKVKHPVTYQRILDADKASLQKHHGHGNAIAQCYNHMIMPLANRRDKVTQIKWGLEDFRDRFKREAESIWLPETACNEETLEVLVEEGIKYIILEPHQAEAVKPINGGEWQDVSQGQINPRMPYRVFLKKDRTRYIDIFFYDGPISKSVGFEDILADSKRMLERIQSAIDAESSQSQLISIATDGETYGHHKAWGDRTLAYLLHEDAPKAGMRVVNYGEYLAEHPPVTEVRLKDGDNGEGTSWSCSHGVKRWKANCGCRGDGPADWNQEWRGPLREALDWLRDELARVFENMTGELFHDPWGARDRYIEVVLHRNEAKIQSYMKREQKKELSAYEVLKVIKLLEMQRFAMLMYTSCGWFFTELSGIETVQILQYAARAIQIAREIGGGDFEREFLDRVSQAKSNSEHFEDGRDIYMRLVLPEVATLHHVAAFYAIRSLFGEGYSDAETTSIHCFDLKPLHLREESFRDIRLGFGRVEVFSRVTREKEDLVFVVAQLGLYDFRCSVKPFVSQEELETLENDLFEGLRELSIVDLVKKIDSSFGSQSYDLKTLLLEDRTRIAQLLTRETLARAGKVYDRLYEESRRINEVYRSVNLPIPGAFKFSAQHALSEKIRETLWQLPEEKFSLVKARALYHLFHDAEELDIQIKDPSIGQFMSTALYERIRQFIQEPGQEILAECHNIMKIAAKCNIEMDLRQPQDALYVKLKGWRDAPQLPVDFDQYEDKFWQLVSDLQFSVSQFKSRLKKADATT